jgi:hypothetical protein
MKQVLTLTVLKDYFLLTQTGPNTYSAERLFSFDTANSILSYVQGAYDSANPPNTGASASVPPIYRAGFNRKENKYYATEKKINTMLI